MHYLDFINPEYKKGINTTVRLGTKWKDRVVPDDIVSLVPHGLAKIRAIHCCKFADIPAEVLQKEHDQECREIGGLIKAMKRAYPELRELNSEQLEETTVTCLYFWPYLKS